jgi:hypothetical protein
MPDGAASEPPPGQQPASARPALTTPDEELRSRALLGLGHCVWSNDVRDAMKLIVATSGSESARREAGNWLRTRAIEESNER